MDDEDQPLGEYPELSAELAHAIRIANQCSLFKQAIDELIDSVYNPPGV